MTYVDGFVAAVPTNNREIYKKHAQAAAAVFKEHGALKFVECWGDDVPEGKVTSFPMAVKQLSSPGSSGHRGARGTRPRRKSWPILA
jgi:uncharacterized protein YbaA (DUF1428 family)